VVLTRDFQSAAPAEMGDVQPPLPASADAGMPDGLDIVVSPDGELFLRAASPEDDGTAEPDPDAELRDQILTEHRPVIEAEVAQRYQGQFDQLRQQKDNELHRANVALAREQAQMRTMVQFLQQRAADLGLTEGDFAILKNNGREQADQVERHLHTAQSSWRAAQADLNARLEEHLTDNFGPAGQRSYNPWGDPQFMQLWGAGTAAAARYYANGASDQNLLLAAQHGLAQVKAYLQAKGKGGMSGQQAPAQPAAQRPTPPNPAQVRADQRASGPTAPARTGGTGRLTDDAVWDMADKKYPGDYKRTYQEYLKLRAQHNVEG
jgi:hypothetical protein